MSDHIPREVLADIFTKLTINEIGRCSCVCKSWYALITSPSFVSLHTKLITCSSSTPTNPLLLVRDHDSIDSSGIHPQHFSLHSDTDSFAKIKTFDFPFKSWNSNFRLIGCFNGVVCLSNDLISYSSDEIVLWNPSIRKALTLPKPLASFESNTTSFVHSIGFGFDAAKDDYKVVKVVNFIDYWADEIPPHVEVYELKIGYWRSLNLRRSIPYVIDQRSPQAFLNGSVHWVGYNREDPKAKRILSFDMTEEVFGVMKVPDCLLTDNHTNLRVSVMRELLSLIRYKWPGSCDIWVMKQYGVCASWTRLFSVELTGGLREVFGFRRNGEALLWDKIGNGTRLASFEPESRRVTCIGTFSNERSFDVESYVESLALLEVKGRGYVKKAEPDNTVVNKGCFDVHVQKKMKI